MKRSILLAIAPLGQIGLVFLKIGLIFFGGGYVLISVLHQELVQELHWMSERQFLDGVAFSQLTPGPVAILATFCGFIRGGVPGALVATIAVFLPAFILMSFISHGYGHLREIPSVRAVLNMLIPAIVGLLVATAAQIGLSTLRSSYGAALFVISLILMIRWKVSPAILIGAGALLGYLLRL